MLVKKEKKKERNIFINEIFVIKRKRKKISSLQDTHAVMRCYNKIHMIENEIIMKNSTILFS